MRRAMAALRRDLLAWRSLLRWSSPMFALIRRLLVPLACVTALAGCSEDQQNKL